MFLQTSKQRVRKPEIPLHEFALLFRSVHTCCMNDEICFFAVQVEFFRIRINIIFIDGVNV